MLEVSGLTVAYRGFTLGPVELELDEGEFLSLIGPNGSGKSTLLRAILGLNRHVSAGTAMIARQDAARRSPEMLARVGYVSDSARDVLAEFTAREYWNYCRLAHERALGGASAGWDERAERFCRLLDFPLDQRHPISALSLGTARKAQLIAALLPRPEFLVLDEPFIGLDFVSSRAFEDLLRELKGAGVTVVASSHDLDLAARVADRIAVLHHGRMILDARVSELGSDVEDTVTRALAVSRRVDS